MPPRVVTPGIFAIRQRSGDSVHGPVVGIYAVSGALLVTAGLWMALVGILYWVKGK